MSEEDLPFPEIPETRSLYDRIRDDISILHGNKIEFLEGFVQGLSERVKELEDKIKKMEGG